MHIVHVPLAVARAVRKESWLWGKSRFNSERPQARDHINTTFPSNTYKYTLLFACPLPRVSGCACSSCAAGYDRSGGGSSNKPGDGNDADFQPTSEVPAPPSPESRQLQHSPARKMEAKTKSEAKPPGAAAPAAPAAIDCAGNSPPTAPWRALEADGGWVRVGSRRRRLAAPVPRGATQTYITTFWRTNARLERDRRRQEEAERVEAPRTGRCKRVRAEDQVQGWQSPKDKRLHVRTRLAVGVNWMGCRGCLAPVVRLT